MPRWESDFCGLCVGRGAHVTWYRTFDEGCLETNVKFWPYVNPAIPINSKYP